MPQGLTQIDVKVNRSNWRDDSLKCTLLSLMIGGGIVFLPLACISLVGGLGGPNWGVMREVFIGLAFWPLWPLSYIFPESPGEFNQGGPPEHWLLIAPIISIFIYSVMAYIILSCLASRGRLK
jgi:Na+/proline symporter